MWALICPSFVLGVTVAVAPPQSHQRRQRPLETLAPRLADAPQAIYSPDPGDSWNRIFFYLFSRRISVWFSSEFPEAAPFQSAGAVSGAQNLRVSTRPFERLEIGDRAIDPLYPYRFTDLGVRIILRDPAYSQFRKAVQEALDEPSARPLVARAVMQSDLWSAYDILHSYKRFERDGETELSEHRRQLLGLLARLIRKLAMNPDAIASLPANYAVARDVLSLPDLFGKNQEWVELQWFPNLAHDNAAGYRRVTRVFVKPARAPSNVQKFLDDLRRPETHASSLDGVALIVQPLLIDSQGRLQPSPLTTELQLRLPGNATAGSPPYFEATVYEINRRRLLGEPASGGLVREAETDGAYFSSAIDTLAGADPIVVRLRTRCVLCHGDKNLAGLMTFSRILPPESGTGPPVRRLDPAGRERADFVISQKNSAEDWADLRKTFEQAQP